MASIRMYSFSCIAILVMVSMVLPNVMHAQIRNLSPLRGQYQTELPDQFKGPNGQPPRRITITDQDVDEALDYAFNMYATPEDKQPLWDHGFNK